MPNSTYIGLNAWAGFLLGPCTRQNMTWSVLATVSDASDASDASSRMTDIARAYVRARERVIPFSTSEASEASEPPVRGMGGGGGHDPYSFREPLPHWCLA